MHPHRESRAPRRRTPAGLWALAALAALTPAAHAQGWSGYGRNAQHTALASNGSLLPQKIRWSTKVDLAPQYTGGGDLLTHYGSPLITRSNNVVVPVKTTAAGGFRVEVRRGSDGTLLFPAIATDYVLPAHNWIPPMAPTLTPKDRNLVIPAAGGTVLVRSFPDSAAGTVTRVAFFGNANYLSNPTAFNAAIQICTPITCDALGNIYFGYVSTGAAVPGFPSGIPSGLARISATGVGSFTSAATLSGNASMTKPVTNCAPALSNDGTAVYIAVNNGSANGYLCCANSTTLATITAVLLRDPKTGANSWVNDDGTASPTVAPDGTVFYGVLESNFPGNNARGWLLQFTAGLVAKGFPGAFGWDDTASIVPASSVPTYTGSSTYLIMTKYNNYAGIGTGNGVNKIAVLDPSASMTDPVSGIKVMQEVLTVKGATPDADHGGLPAVREWCINSAAIDPINKCAVVNSEDGHVYRWDFITNTLSTGLMLAPPTGEAYTPTVIGPDGAVYAINNATLFCCVAN